MALTQVAAGLLAGSITSSQITSVSGASLTGTQNIPKATLPTGTVLQVVNGSTATGVSTASDAYLDTGLTATITPSSATSKILVVVSQNGVYADSIATLGLDIFLFKNATQLAKIGGRTAGDRPSSTIMSIGSVSCNYLDSPATTSATTYKTQFLSVNNNTTVYVQVYQALSTITLMEISA